ncbi:hypothetical protein GJW-30_1_01915 [Variibacter gotjawalensis]|uniref:Uncharacterized protein n=1 Tax=Variibacter gotjawalensis TaxID=1333996 RepID=A0A0S3PTV7_9BRAD|nr:hypothetical protein [Variibacter gotjawalensis]NIK49700.1 hypothetical protein [Variibacter gotjawalensis]RZS45712.1 hypothetical protein EV661_4033 [Variibacter gotjawalensis]BAT59383.1 hypothetical protein GJW-30_1_01915 [Variibacter gotjawalensis]
MAATFLRNTLIVDAATCLAAGALMAFGASFVAGLTAIPATLLFYAGLSLFPIAAFMLWAGTREVPPAAAVWLIIIGNVGWVIGSVAAMLLVGPNVLGHLFIAAQAAAVAVLAWLEYEGLRRNGAPLAA